MPQNKQHKWPASSLISQKAGHHETVNLTGIMHQADTFFGYLTILIQLQVLYTDEGDRKTITEAERVKNSGRGGRGSL